MNYRVHSPATASWSVTSPSGNRVWSGAQSQPVAFNLATSLAAIDTMLANLPLQVLVGGAQRPPRYGCYRVPSKAR